MIIDYPLIFIRLSQFTADWAVLVYDVVFVGPFVHVLKIFVSSSLLNNTPSTKPMISMYDVDYM